MGERVIKMHRRMLGLFQKEMQAWMDELLKDAFDPAKVMAFIRSMGFDPSRLPGMMSREPGPDPYQLLGLDRSAGDDEVKRRYIAVMNRVHPDKAGREMTYLAALVNAAYKKIGEERGWR